jgi:mitochondrial fission protein ELM1
MSVMNGSAPAADGPHPDNVPRVWLLMGHKIGDNAQVLALAEALGWPFETKRFVYSRWELFALLALGATLAGIDRERSSPLVPPWPDLVLTAGRRNEPVARWIREAARPKRVRLVHIGRPWSNLDVFDLVVTTPQYRLPVRPNILHNHTPLHRVTPEKLAAAAAAWEPRLADLPRPFTALMIGGSAGAYVYDDRAAARLARQASDLVRERGGSLLVTTSARTPPSTIDAFLDTLSVPVHLYRWSKDAAENPYFAFLGLADAIIATGDSMSMLTEACATQKPVYIFDVGEGRTSMRPEVARAAAGARRSPRVKTVLHHLAMSLGPQRMSRDIRFIHQFLLASGHAVWLGDAFPDSVALPKLDCLDRAVAAVRALFD